MNDYWKGILIGIGSTLAVEVLLVLLFIGVMALLAKAMVD